MAGWILMKGIFRLSPLYSLPQKMGLYDFQKSYSQHENLLTTLLRTYEGIFDFPAFISEHFIARLLKKDETDVKQQLKTIASFGIIQYMPQNNEPQLIFRKNRVAADELLFNLMPYYKRRDVFVSRAKKMIEYVETPACRSQFISLYFGDEKAIDCGVCDNCVKRKNSTLSAEEFDKISSIILEQLSIHELTIQELLEKLSSIKKEKAWKVIEFLQAEKKIEPDGKGLLKLK